MLDIKFIRENLERVRLAAEQKRKTVDFDTLLQLDDERKQIQQKIEEIRAQKNKASKEIPQLSGEEKTQLIASMQALGEEEKELQERMLENDSSLNKLLLQVPNIIADGVPVGKDDAENVEVDKWGEIKTFPFEAKDHITLMNNLGMLDIERGVKIAGSRSYFLKGDGMLLEQAILRYTLDKLVSKGFVPMSVPFIVDPSCFAGTGYFPGGEDDAYYCEKDDKYLIATSEIPLMSYHRDEILEEKNLPIFYAGSSTCFRREAGSYGKDTQGLYRIHQFNKIEQVVIMSADMSKSESLHAWILENAREVLKDFGIPHRLLQLCTGDMSLGKYNSQDLECWMYSRNSYGETHSVSNFLDFQCRRLNIRYRDNEGNIQHCYSLNNTAIATPRFLIAFIEHHQLEDGSIAIPEALQSYFGKSIIQINS